MDYRSLRLASVVVAWLSVPGVTANQRGGLVMYTSIGEYFGTVYIGRPVAGAEYVVLVGQPIVAHVILANTGTDVGVQGGAPGESPLVSATLIGPGSVAPLHLNARETEPLLHGMGQERTVRFPVVLRGLQRLQWTVELPGTARLAPQLLNS
jgi:hypothetical protein